MHSSVPDTYPDTMKLDRKTTVLYATLRDDPGQVPVGDRGAIRSDRKSHSVPHCACLPFPDDPYPAIQAPSLDHLLSCPAYALPLGLCFGTSVIVSPAATKHHDISFSPHNTSGGTGRERAGTDMPIPGGSDCFSLSALSASLRTSV